MKQTITCVFAALLAVAHGQTDNLLPNPSFETNSASGVEGWLSRAWTGGDEARHEVLATGRNGGQCVSIRSANGSDAAWTAKVNAQQGKTYELSGWIKTEGLKGAIGALLNIQNTSVKTTAVTGTSDWRRVGAVFVADRPELVINCLFGGWGNATGKPCRPGHLPQEFPPNSIKSLELFDLARHLAPKSNLNKKSKKHLDSI